MKHKFAFAMGIGGMLVLAVFAPHLKQSIASVRPYTSKHTGTLFSKVSLTGWGTVQMGLAQAPSRFHMRFTGDLERSVWEHSDHTRSVVYKFKQSQYSVSINEVENPALAQQVSANLAQEPFEVDTDAQGKVMRILANPNIKPATKGILRTFAMATQGMGGKMRGSMERDEIEADMLQGGHARVHYSTNGKTISRNRQAYFPPITKWGRVEPSEVLKGDYKDQCAFTQDANTSELMNGKALLQGTVYRGKTVISKITTQIEIQTRSEEARDATFSPLSQQSENILLANDYAEADKRLYESTLGEDTFETLSHKTTSALNSNELVGLDRKWRSLLLLERVSWEQFREFALQQRGSALLYVANALMQVQTDAAQTLLWELYNKHRNDPQESMVLNFIAGVEIPTESSRRSMASLAQKEDDEGCSAAVALGIMARQWSDDEPKQARVLVSQLERQAIDESRSLLSREAAIIGIGNSACPDAFPTLMKLTKSKVTSLRDTAVRVLHGNRHP